MTGGINDKKSGDIDWGWEVVLAFCYFVFQLVMREECSPDLLGNTSGFSFLDVGPSNFVQQSCLAGIDVAQDTADRTSIFPMGLGEELMLVFEDIGLLLFLPFFCEPNLDFLFFIYFFLCVFIDVLLIHFQLFFYVLELLFGDSLLVCALLLLLSYLGTNLLDSLIFPLLLFFLSLLLFFLLSFYLLLVLPSQPLLLLLECFLLFQLLFGQQGSSSHFASFFPLLVLALLLGFGFRLFCLLDFFLIAFLDRSKSGSFFLLFLFFLKFLQLTLGEALGRGVPLIFRLVLNNSWFFLFLTHLEC